MSMLPTHWSPPSGPDLEMQRTGVVWDAVRVSASIGAQALARLGARNGAVIRDPQARALYWLVHPGTADAWDLNDVVVLGVACWVGVPPAQRTCGPSPHWEIPPTPTGAVPTPLCCAARAGAGHRRVAVVPTRPLLQM